MEYETLKHYDWTPLYDYADKLLRPHGMHADRDCKTLWRGQAEVSSNRLPYAGNEDVIRQAEAAGLKVIKREPDPEKQGELDEGMFFVEIPIPQKLKDSMELLPDAERMRCPHCPTLLEVPLPDVCPNCGTRSTLFLK